MFLYAFAVDHVTTVLKIELIFHLEIQLDLLCFLICK